VHSVRFRGVTKLIYFRLKCRIRAIQSAGTYREIGLLLKKNVQVFYNSWFSHDPSLKIPSARYLHARWTPIVPAKKAFEFLSWACTDGRSAVEITSGVVPGPGGMFQCVIGSDWLTES
jgi:hypothetical protein